MLAAYEHAEILQRGNLPQILMDYLKYFIPASAAEQEILLALLSEFSFDTFEEGEEGLSAFMPLAAKDADQQAKIEQMLSDRGLNSQIETIAHKNWNAIWEAGFEPIRIPGVCLVRAKFHEPEAEFPLEIIIQPEMAFGTGHHATTYLMMKRMADLSFSGKNVLDFGCGTGILAILASKLGANKVVANDNDPLAVDNTIQQLQLNGIVNVSTHLATLDELERGTFDIILANINRNVLLATMPALSRQLVSGGQLLLSGILAHDVALIKQAVSEAQLSLVQVEQKEDWTCLHAEKLSPNRP